uniref:Uncharacterized protein n=1 Tax=Mantoniella antarctica TaxID=81844 RepID=A0A7S0SZ31_9CHLO
MLQASVHAATQRTAAVPTLRPSLRHPRLAPRPSGAAVGTNGTPLSRRRVVQASASRSTPAGGGVQMSRLPPIVGVGGLAPRLHAAPPRRGALVRANGVQGTFVGIIVAGFITYIYFNLDEIIVKQKAAVAKAEAEQSLAINQAQRQQRAATDAAKKSQENAGKAAAEAAAEAQRRANGPR